MIRNCLYVLVIFFVSATDGYAQFPLAVHHIPASIRHDALATVRNEDIQVQMTDDSRVSLHISRAITVHHELGDDHAVVAFYYTKSRQIKSVKGEIFDQHGIPYGKFSLKDFQDNSASGQHNLYDDLRVKTFQPVVRAYPYTIVYTAEITEKQNLSIPAWYPTNSYGVAVEQSTYRFTCRPDHEIRIQEANLEKPAQITEDAKTKAYTWSCANIPAVKFEPFSPPQEHQIPSVRIVPVSFHYYNRKGTSHDWNELGKWVYDELLADKRALPQTAIKHIHAITDSLHTPKEKAAALYTYLQAKTRYISIQVGIGGLEPFSASTVDRVGYGDCKALVNYMQSMLDIVQIPSYYCVVEAGSTKKDLSYDFANVTDGNHIILCLPFENDTTWLECTSNELPFGYLGEFTDDRLVLACTAEGGRLLRTPGYSAQENLQYREAFFEISESGSLTGQVKTSFSGNKLYKHGQNLRQSREEQVKNLKRWYDQDNMHFEQIHYTLNNQRDTLRMDETLHVQIKNYLVASDRFAVLYPNIFNQASAISASRNRAQPVHIARGFRDVDVLHYRLPTYIQENIRPGATLLKVPMGQYSLHTEVRDGVMICTRVLEVYEGNYAPETYADFYEFMAEVQAADRGKYNLSLKND